MKENLLKIISAILAACLLLMYHPGSSQALALNQPLQKSEPKLLKLGFVLEELSKMYNVDVAYSSRKLKHMVTTSQVLNRSLTVEENLAKLLGPLGFTFKKVNGSSYIVFENSPTRQNASGNGVLPSQIGSRSTDGITITGKVIDVQTQEILVGASILVKGTNIGTFTDANGLYTIKAVDENSILIFSYVGYEASEIQVGKQTVLNASLKARLESLSEVVVIGYGTQRKSDITGSVASLKLKDLETAPSTRIDQSLQGRIAGVNVQNTDASPNAQTAIRIRGANSINGGNDPLIVVDGMQGGSLSILNPNDVESMEVLKDASATAIYGSKGANGVIIVTTRQGKVGKPTISFNSYFSSAQVRQKLDQLSASQYALIVNENRKEFNMPTVFTDADIAGFAAKGGSNWQDIIFRNGLTQNHQLGISGGGENVSYYLSGNATKQTGLVKGSSYNRYSLRTNIKTNLNEKITVGLNGFLAREIDHPTILNSFTGANAGSPIFSALLWAPTKSIYDANGNYTLPGGGTGPNTNYNPLALAVEPVRDYFTTTINLTGNVNYAIVKGLNLNVLGSYRSAQSERNDYFNSKPTQAAGTEIASILNQGGVFLQNTNMLTYDKQVDGGHTFKLTGVFEQQFEQFNSNYSGSQGFSTDALTYNNLALGQNPQIPNSSRTSRSLLSYLGRLNYVFQDKYLLTITARADGSSVFGNNNKWGYFPSVAVGWNVTNESFMVNAKNFLTDLKLRGSYGIVGNQAIAPYQSLATLSTSSYPINGISLSTGVGMGGSANPDLRWEKTAQTNIGIDALFLNGRIEFTADYYNKQTTDLLLAVPLPMIAGGSGSVLKNVGAVENKGIELYIAATPFKNTLTWKTGLTFALNHNEVLGLADGQKEILLGNPGLPGFTKSLWLEVGQPLGLFRGFQFDGVWKSNEAELAKKFSAKPGDSKYKDQNNDGVIDDLDVINIGNAQPKFSYGWNNNLNYKGFDLNVFIQGVYGNRIYNISRVRFETSSGDGDATSAKVLDRWTPQNENTDVPTFTGSNDGRLNSSRWIEDGSYVRLKNISFGYTFSKNAIKALRLSQLHIYAGLTNWLTLTKYTGFDPESTLGVDTRAGIDLATYPAQKSFTLGLNVKF